MNWRSHEGRKIIGTRYDLPTQLGQNAWLTGTPGIYGAEVGVDHGHFSYYLLRHYNFERLFSIDSWSGKFAERKLDAHSHLDNFGSRSDVLHCDSLMGAKYLLEHGWTAGLDFVYIDASHRYRDVKSDIAAWRKLVRPGGILAGHDYIEARGCGVIQAVNEFAIESGWELLLTREHWASWAFVVQEEK
jgi:hypothetical protein